MEIICINDSFTPRQISLIPNRPVLNKIYTIRDLFKTEFGMAVHLNEIHNPHVNGGVIGTTELTFEPSFSVTRFTDLLSNPLNVEELVRELKKEKTNLDINI